MNSRELGGKGPSSKLILKRLMTSQVGLCSGAHGGERVPYKIDSTNHVYCPGWQGMHQYKSKEDPILQNFSRA